MHQLPAAPAACLLHHVFTCCFPALCSALLAEGLHSLADVANQLLLKHGVIRSRRKPTRQHQYGFRELWAVGVTGRRMGL